MRSNLKLERHGVQPDSEHGMDHHGRKRIIEVIAGIQRAAELDDGGVPSDMPPPD